MSDLLLERKLSQPRFACILCEGTTRSRYFDSRAGVGVHLRKKHGLSNKRERESQTRVHGAPQHDAAAVNAVSVKLTKSERMLLDQATAEHDLPSRSEMLRVMMDHWYGCADPETWKFKFEREHRIRLNLEAKARQNALALESIISRLENMKRE